MNHVLGIILGFYVAFLFVGLPIIVWEIKESLKETHRLLKSMAEEHLNSRQILVHSISLLWRSK